MRTQPMCTLTPSCVISHTCVSQTTCRRHVRVFEDRAPERWLDSPTIDAVSRWTVIRTREAHLSRCAPDTTQLVTRLWLLFTICVEHPARQRCIVCRKCPAVKPSTPAHRKVCVCDVQSRAVDIMKNSGFMVGVSALLAAKFRQTHYSLAGVIINTNSSIHLYQCECQRDTLIVFLYGTFQTPYCGTGASRCFPN